MRPAWLENWLIRNTPPCREVVRILSDAMDRPIPLRRRIAVRLHFLICQWCERYQKQIRLIRTLLRREESISPPDTPNTSNARLSDEARERLKRLTRQDRS
ncbi:MAG: zf-HC2 domain-containing protein [Nitrospirae bacterium]|nr:zf-HC2 domain-containing protein [Nitrospirota bacterium]